MKHSRDLVRSGLIALSMFAIAATAHAAELKTLTTFDVRDILEPIPELVVIGSDAELPEEMPEPQPIGPLLLDLLQDVVADPDAITLEGSQVRGLLTKSERTDLTHVLQQVRATRFLWLGVELQVMQVPLSLVDGHAKSQDPNTRPTILTRADFQRFNNQLNNSKLVRRLFVSHVPLRNGQTLKCTEGLALPNKAIADGAENQASQFSIMLTPTLSADRRYVTFAFDAELEGVAAAKNRELPTALPTAISMPVGDWMMLPFEPRSEDQDWRLVALVKPTHVKRD